MRAGWRDPFALSIEVEIDTANDPNFGPPPATFAISPEAAAAGSLSMPFRDMFTTTAPTQGFTYRFTVTINDSNGRFISLVIVYLQFDDLGGDAVEQPEDGEITLSPKLSVVVTVPSTTPRQLTVNLHAGDNSPPQNVTGEVSFRWIGHGLSPGDVDLD